MTAECERCGSPARNGGLVDTDEYGTVCVPCLDYLEHEA